MNKLPRAAASVATFGLGAFGFVHQVLSQGAEKPYLLVACLLMMGLPIAQYLDLLRRRGDS